jgi:hypothetical protein
MSAPLPATPVVLCSTPPGPCAFLGSVQAQPGTRCALVDALFRFWNPWFGYNCYLAVCFVEALVTKQRCCDANKVSRSCAHFAIKFHLPEDQDLLRTPRPRTRRPIPYPVPCQDLRKTPVPDKFAIDLENAYTEQQDRHTDANPKTLRPRTEDRSEAPRPPTGNRPVRREPHPNLKHDKICPVVRERSRRDRPVEPWTLRPTPKPRNLKFVETPLMCEPLPETLFYNTIQLVAF